MRILYMVAAIVPLVFCGCQDGENIAGVNGDDDLGNGGEVETPDGSSEGDGNELDIPSGTVALFISMSMDSRDESWPTVGGSVSWDETDTGLLRYLPTLGVLDVLATTTSFSFSSSHLYPVSVGGRLFAVNTRSRKSILEYDARSGVSLGTVCELTTDDEYSGFAIVGERVFYIDGAGDLAAEDLPCTGTAEKLLDADQHAINGRSMYGIGDQLISVGFKMPDQYEIRRHNTATGAVEEILLTLSDEEVFGAFFAGDDGLYWVRFDEETLRLAVVRYPLGGTPQEIVTRTLTTALNAGYTIDESRGKVLVVYMDGFPASGGKAHFLLYDGGGSGSSGEVEELAIDNSFLGLSI